MKLIRSTCLAVLLLATLPLLAVMCSRKNNDPAPQNAHPSVVASVWSWENLYVDPPVDNITDILDFYIQLNILTAKCLPILLYEFKADGSLIPYEQPVCQSTGSSALKLGPQTGDKWSVKGSKITITHADGSKDEADLELKDGTSGSGAKAKIMIWKRKIGTQQYTWRFGRNV